MTTHSEEHPLTDMTESQLAAAWGPRRTMTLDDLAVPLTDEDHEHDWNDDGVVIVPGLIPDDLIAAYREEWSAANGLVHVDWDEHADDRPGHGVPGLGILHADRPGGWPDCTPYMRHRALRDLVCSPQIAKVLEETIGEPAGVHLNLSGWVSTERNWHQDGYLNPPHVGDVYAAVWISLGWVHPDSGPFQFIPGSHKWHRLTRELIGQHVDLGDPAWPKHSEDVLTPLVERELQARYRWGVTWRAAHWANGVGEALADGRLVRHDDSSLPNVLSYLPHRGDVLLWHPRLYHRGSRATVPGAYRPGLIAHYSGVHHRQDMPAAVPVDGQRVLSGEQPLVWMFPIESSGPVS